MDSRCRVPPSAPSKKSRIVFNSLITYSTSLIVLRVHEALLLAKACTLLSDILSIIGNFNCPCIKNWFLHILIGVDCVREGKNEPHLERGFESCKHEKLIRPPNQAASEPNVYSKVDSKGHS